MPIITLDAIAIAKLKAIGNGDLTHIGKSLDAKGQRDVIITLALYKLICSHRKPGETFNAAITRLK